MRGEERDVDRRVREDMLEQEPREAEAPERILREEPVKDERVAPALAGAVGVDLVLVVGIAEDDEPAAVKAAGDNSLLLFHVERPRHPRDDRALSVALQPGVEDEVLVRREAVPELARYLSFGQPKQW